MYTLPFNMWTFNQLWDVIDPEKAQEELERTKYKGKITISKNRQCLWLEKRFTRN
jgi:UDP-galactopyranose mutase